jgi:hypothetical protein
MGNTADSDGGKTYRGCGGVVTEGVLYLEDHLTD